MTKPWILGISASHNGACCLLQGDKIVVAIQEERLTRRKRDRIYADRPSLALNYCLNAAGITIDDIDMVAISSQGASSMARIEFTEYTKATSRIPMTYLPHHLAHAISAYATSGFDEAAVLVIDGLGSPYYDLTESERLVGRGASTNGWETLSTYLITKNEFIPIDKHLIENGEWIIKNIGKMWGFRSLGGMFSSIAQQIFGDPMEAGKVMGLAPYGKPIFGVSDFFSITDGLICFGDGILELYPFIDRWPNHELAYSNLAASAQLALEEAVLSLSRRLRSQSGSSNLCYAGGVALNGIANQRLHRDAAYSSIHIIPAAEDSGVAVGAAYFGLFQLTGRFLGSRQISDATGYSYSSAQIDSAINSAPMVEILPSKNTIETVADMLCAGKIGGWFQDGSELGPRALGQRSILCDPRRIDSKDVLNRRVKHREAFRPFAPVIILDEVPKWFDLEFTTTISPFMLRVISILPEKRKLIPGVTHVDGTGRMQSIDRGLKLYNLLQCFFKKTNIPILINTSFNIMGEPIVETPEDALWCMLSTGIDFCVLGDSIVVKKTNYKSILDLTPKLIVSTFELNGSIGSNMIDFSLVEKINITTNTPWGELNDSIDIYDLNLLRLIDGKTSGWHLLEQLTDKYDADNLTKTLSLLKRRRVISVTPLSQN